jgi:hypothetical protein
MISIIFSLLLLRDASLTRCFNAITRALAASIKAAAVLRAFSVSRVIVRLKNIVFSNFSYLFPDSGAAYSLYWRGVVTLIPCSGL